MKKVILSLFIGFITIISFCSAGSFTYDGTLGGGLAMTIPQNSLSPNILVHCDFIPLSSCEGTWQFKWNFSYLYGNLSSAYGASSSQSSWIVNDCSTTTSFDTDLSSFSYPSWASPLLGVVSFNISSLFIPDGLSINYICTFNGDSVYSAGGICPEVNTGEILSGYILESDINNLYCEEHGYCPIIDTGEELSGMSALFINEIEHQSAPLINITIPEEYNWDSSVDTGEFNLVISGTNVDHEYIDNIIRIQNSKPSSEDLTNIVSGLIPLFIPGLCIILLLYFIYLFIKKIF